MLNQITDSFFSKLMEKSMDYVFDTLSNRKNLESTLKTLNNNLNSLSDKAFAVEEKIKKAELSGYRKRKREVEEWLKQVKLIEDKFRTLESEVQTQGFVKKFISGGQATQLSTEVDELVEQSQHFGDRLVDVYETSGEKLLTTNLCGKGFKENLKMIWNLLKSDEVSNIGIYGMGGVGKTALARHINNIILEKRKEGRVCWITVSQMISIKNLQDQIARFIGLDLYDEDDEDKRAAKLHRAIRNNLILILDDVWENICLEKLGDPLRLEGCKLILTTRSFEVCCRMGCQEKVKVSKLRMDEAWNLFKQKLGRQDVPLCPEAENIAKSMAKVCCGLPLGIIVLAGSMRGETCIHVWRNELEKLRDPNMVQDDDKDEVFTVLKYSFDRLDLNHQLCFLQCSLYPEDYMIDRNELSERFISEELVDIRKSWQSQLDQAHSILNKLVKVCLLEHVNGFSVKMHDLVRAMALKITKRTNMVISGFRLKEIPNEEEWIKDPEKVSFMHNNITKILDGISPNCPNLRTLTLSGNPLKFISDSFFSGLDSLCFLDLSRTEINKLPNSLSNLENLKALNLGFCDKLVDIPYLGKLKKLRRLDLFGTTIKKVPQAMEELANLRFLSLDEAGFLNSLPKGLFLNIPHLQCLHLPCQIEAPVEEIAKLKRLEEFRGRIKNMTEFNKYIRCRQHRLTASNIMVSGGVNKYHFLFSNVDNKMNQVKVQQCDLKNEKDEVLGMLVRDVQILILEQYEGLSSSLVDDFLRLDIPCPLNILEVIGCQGIECFLTNEQFLAASQELRLHFLPLRNLQRLTLIGLQNFIGLIQNIGAAIEPPLPQAVVFSSLRSLHISGCNKMRKLGLPLSEFQNLEEIGIKECDEIEEIIEVREAEGRVVFLPKLKALILWFLPRLKSICKTTMTCGSIETITLMECRELRKLSLHFDPISHSPPQTLAEIWVREGDEEWWESLEWEHPTHYRLLQPLVRFC